MAKCSTCQGTGYEVYDEDGRTVRDACYHCGMSGEVDEDTDFHDRLRDVANTLAYYDEKAYKHYCNTDPDGDGYGLHAAENQMSEYDYFRTQVWDREYEFAEKLAAMPLASQELLIAWNEMPYEPMKAEVLSSFQPTNVIQLFPESSNDIPF